MQIYNLWYKLEETWRDTSTILLPLQNASFKLLPKQFTPLPEKPFKHVQKNDPFVFVQLASVWQLWESWPISFAEWLRKHSFRSERKNESSQHL